jgi:plastocyanin
LPGTWASPVVIVASFIFAICLLAVVPGSAVASAQTNTGTVTGTIRGHVRLTGARPGNPIIRMGMDPKCSQMNADKRVVQEIVSSDEHGNLANVFVSLSGNFPATPVPSQPVTIDQRKCMFTPRVVGVRVGQTLRVVNDDPISHNVQSLSSLPGGANYFDVTTPASSAPFSFRLRQEEVMLRVVCDLHKWMTTYVGVVTNPYFAVSGEGGAFEIDNVPAGTHTISAWQEEYGVVKKTVSVTARGTATVDFAYTGKEKPSATGRP